jgi:hypothetical protein
MFAALSAEIMGRFTGMLALAGPELPETQPASHPMETRLAQKPTASTTISDITAMPPQKSEYHTQLGAFGKYE